MTPARRRAHLTLVLLLALAACSDRRPASTPANTSSAPASTTTTTAPKLDPAVPWTPPPGEVEVELKTAAASAVTTLLTYGAGGGTPDAARARISGQPVEPVVVDRLTALLHPDRAAAADVLYPQLGGYTGNAASAMVVTRLRFLEGRRTAEETRTIDVRLTRRQGAWRVVDVSSLGGDQPAATAALSPTAQAILDNPRIELPDSARWDIASGRIDERVLESLRVLADTHDVRVAVLSSGHPLEVFGSKRGSNHIPGRAVDVWSLDGPVVSQRAADGPLRPVLEMLLARGVTELGAPFDIDQTGGANFANLVHQDHLHIGYDG